MVWPELQTTNLWSRRAGLVLLPAQKDELLAEWQGPYTIHKRITDVTYEIFMLEEWKKNHIFHVNMLDRWESLTAACLVVEEATEERVTGKVSTWQVSQTVQNQRSNRTNQNSRSRNYGVQWRRTGSSSKTLQAELTSPRYGSRQAMQHQSTCPHIGYPRQDIRQFRMRFSSYWGSR